MYEQATNDLSGRKGGLRTLRRSESWGDARSNLKNGEKEIAVTVNDYQNISILLDTYLKESYSRTLRHRHSTCRSALQRSYVPRMFRVKRCLTLLADRSASGAGDWVTAWFLFVVLRPARLAPSTTVWYLLLLAFLSLTSVALVDLTSSRPLFSNHSALGPRLTFSNP